MTTTSSKRRRKPAAPCDYVERSIYDGMRLLGSFAPKRGGSFEAWDRQGKRLGVFATIDDARLAIAASAG